MSEPATTYPRVGPFDDATATCDIDSFIVGARSIGLPVSYLSRLHEKGWTCKIDQGRDTSFTPSNWVQNLVYGDKTIHLAPSQCFPNSNAAPFNSAACLGTLYHEFTHAYLIEFEDTLQSLLAIAKTHYLGINLKNGKEASDTMHVLHESAASYVGDTIFAIVDLMMARRAGDKGLSSQGMPLHGDGAAEKMVGFALRDFNRFMQKDVFGVVDEVEVTKTIDPKLRAHLDMKVLEGIRSRPPQFWAGGG